MVSEKLKKRLEALRLEYVKSFAEEIRGFQQALTEWNAESCAAVNARAHRIAGTAGSYQLAEVSALARKVEALEPEASKAEADAAVAELCAALEAASAS